MHNTKNFVHQNSSPKQKEFPQMNSEVVYCRKQSLLRSNEVNKFNNRSTTGGKKKKETVHIILESDTKLPHGTRGVG